jgi:hypothetical protein
MTKHFKHIRFTKQTMNDKLLSGRCDGYAPLGIVTIKHVNDSDHQRPDYVHKQG